MYILGIHGNFGRSDHDPAVVLIKDNEIVAAAEEERFVRYKHAVGLMPDRAIKFCLNHAKISMKDVDIVAFPRATWSDFAPRFEAYLWYNFGNAPKIQFVDHHLSHAASAFLISGFPSALILTLDQSGDGTSCGIFRGSDNKIAAVDRIPFPNSLGVFAAFITQYLGFTSNHDEYKVMGLAAYGKPTIDLSNLLAINEGGIKFNQELLHPEVLKRHPIFHTSQLPMFNNRSYSFLPPRRLRGEVVTEEHKNLAASAQKVIEDAVFSIISKYKTDKDQYLCIAGGVGENSVVNGKIAESKIFKDIYVSPACNDAGSALGAALFVANQNGFYFNKVTENKWGTDYDNSYVKSALNAYKIKYQYLENVEGEVAKLLQEQKIVAWFQGNMEFGPRALGSRSILADPSNIIMKDRMNHIKKREEFRPFAPSVLVEHQTELFTVDQFSPFMSFTLPTTKTGKKQIAAATHIDSTGRLQSVSKNNSLYRKVIESFYNLSGIPAVMNTSLNSGWEPIVENPEQALALFYSSEIDVLVIDNFIIRK